MNEKIQLSTICTHHLVVNSILVLSTVDFTISQIES